jgi:YHS domain-containing protein
LGPILIIQPEALKYYPGIYGGELMQKDPVCGMMVDEKKTKLTSKHDNTTFYFCTASCKATFEKDPHKYGHA